MGMLISEVRAIAKMSPEEQRAAIPRIAQEFNKRPERIEQQIEIINKEPIDDGVRFNEDDVRKFYKFFEHKEKTEIRVFDIEKYPHGKSIFVDSEDDFVKQCKYFCVDEEVSVYIGARDRKARGDANVISSHFVFFETDGDEDGAEKEKILEFLASKGVEVSMIGMSGGGWHFYIRHNDSEFATEEEAMQYKKNSLGGFKKVIIGQGFDVDAAVFNLERVTRVLGTYNCKRDKLSYIEKINDAIDVEKNTKNLISLVQMSVSTIPTINNKEVANIDKLEDDNFIKEVKSKWVEGDRQNLAISLAGYLRKNKRLGPNTVVDIVTNICNDVGDTEVAQRIAGVHATFNKDESEIKGATGLIELNIETDPQVLAGKIPIELPGDNSYVSVFADNLATPLKDKKILFYRQDSRQVVELGDIKNEKNEVTHTGFIQMTPGRFTTLIERYFLPFTYRKDARGQKYMVKKSATKEHSSIVLESKDLHDTIHSIHRIFTVQLPIIYEGELTFPKVGYDERFWSWLPADSAKINDMEMTLATAKKTLKDLYKEFCFESEQDYINALSALLTPFLRGLFKTGFNTRAPVYCYEANRERSGKDYCAGVTGMLYEGNALEEPPISSGEYHTSGGNDELRKKLISAMISGKKRLHFSNNKGKLDSAVFESIATATKFTDRLLGKNVDVSFDNEMDFSFSGNLGMTLTPDLANRTIFIKLFLEIENANERKFKNPNLHQYVFNNRDTILSALYALVRNWHTNGSPDGSKPFASYPEWARVCGGIMEAAGYESPCKILNDNSGIAIDSETEEMKELFEKCYEACADTTMSKHEIKAIVQTNNILSNMNWDNHSSVIKFGLKINKFVGRILSNIKMTVVDKSIRSARWEYIFSKNVKPDKIWSF